MYEKFKVKLLKPASMLQLKKSTISLTDIVDVVFRKPVTKHLKKSIYLLTIRALSISQLSKASGHINSPETRWLNLKSDVNQLDWLD